MSKKCPLCEQGTLHREVRRVPYEYKGVSVEVEQPGEWCSSCGEGFLSADDMAANRKALHDAAARARGMLTSDEVRRIRRAMGLTQKKAGEIFGGGPNAFSRYERGIALQPKSLDMLLRLLDRHPSLKTELQYDLAA